MLQELYISNFALIDRITIGLGEGLIVFSGETGVGKSLVIGALNFVLGGRVSSDIVRCGKDEAIVIGKFNLSNQNILRRVRYNFGVDLSENELVIQRSIDVNGRSRCRVNNIPVTVSMLKEIGDLLVNIHGQREHEALFMEENQLRILDEFGDVSPLQEEFSAVYHRFIEKTRLQETLKKRQVEMEQKIDLYTFQVEEIDKARLRVGEVEDLEKERKILNNAEKIYNIITSCYSQLYESSDAIIERLEFVLRELQSAAKFDETIGTVLDGCNQALYQLKDIAFSLEKYRERFSYDPQRLEYIEDRLNSIQRLKSKYGGTEADILTYRDDVACKLNQISIDEAEAGQLEEELQVLTEVINKKGKELTRRRLRTANQLSSLIEKELHDLGIPHGRFHIKITSPFLQDNACPEVSDASSYGFDRVEFMISANPGENLKPLKRIASGGEISRILLALKHQLATVDNTPVLIFDEIDANVGGRMGDVIGKKLKSIACSHQVICITHLPQIASYADEQWKVNKYVKKGKTFSIIERLTGESRLEEIADMIRGKGKTETTRKQAREMLEDAQRRVKSNI